MGAGFPHVRDGLEVAACLRSWQCVRSPRRQAGQRVRPGAARASTAREGVRRGRQGRAVHAGVVDRRSQTHCRSIQ